MKVPFSPFLHAILTRLRGVVSDTRRIQEQERAMKREVDELLKLR